jgi:hypothetical protein
VLLKYIFVTTGVQVAQSTKRIGHGPDIRGSTPIRGHDVISHHRVKKGAPRLTQPSPDGHWECPTPGAKSRGREYLKWRLPQHVLLAWCLFKHWENFTFSLYVIIYYRQHSLKLCIVDVCKSLLRGTLLISVTLKSKEEEEDKIKIDFREVSL